ncbi:hypothetical protein A3D77_05150 [Candidatus Gottesmanbacteria bacterium RIFCSPHIGHO2_02_FULL_39_11]|uniref:Uncharacterized protein n=1 Tax=Candidatus Gottesmanbacteria bacterium RIFCSPHIGHO2_02_FULL_39_11 TaxID=1798382 RepID=A0A1F5ZN96_9BACT|nr:MAG: hypothetical protein A3D77_05150 [Candidatus Gottesmanbacteria bacterium RIFCSPHIGHO2_02_FULL_39_11]
MLNQVLSVFATILSVIRGVPNTPATIQQAPVVVNQPPGGGSACYNPESNVTFTLTTDNFKNLTDYRPQLNPTSFPPSKFSSTFNTKEASCKPMIFTTLSGQTLPSREYIRIRKNLRVASCKTDELTGPYRTDPTVCYNVSVDAASKIRGSCEVAGGSYPDLRKVAEIDDPESSGQTSEVFWTPYTHNVGCEFNDSRPNCGIGDGTNMNMREFLYVLKSRDAFEAAQSLDCKVRWDENSLQNNPCSHYFDVYIAKDLWNKLVAFPTGPYTPLITSDPGYDLYRQNYAIMRDRIFNCKEQNTFTPMNDPLAFPPEYVDKPFTTSISTANPDKIIPASTDDWQKANYNRYIIFNASAPFLNQSLFHIETITETMKMCNKPLNVNATPTLIPIGLNPDNCYSPLGVTTFTKSDTSAEVIFNAFYRADRPQNIFLQTNNDPKIYIYIPTPNKPPTNFARNTSLQLTSLQFRTAAQWTWATPVCKPAIYLYPEEPTDLNVKLAVDGKITVSDPVYDAVNGWNVHAEPNGTLSSLTFNLKPNTYSYLYYEADLNNVKAPEQGFVYAKGDLKNKLTGMLSTIGFNGQEISDFLSYWLPRLDEKPYYFVTLLPENVINEKETLDMSIQPDTVIRSRVIFEGLDAPISVAPIPIPTHKRNGFVLADWGGSIVGESCTVENVK